MVLVAPLLLANLASVLWLVVIVRRLIEGRVVGILNVILTDISMLCLL